LRFCLRDDAPLTSSGTSGSTAIAARGASEEKPTLTCGNSGAGGLKLTEIVYTSGPQVKGGDR
jgi:hypothetical protein